MTQQVFAIEKIVRGYELIPKAVNDRVLVIDRGRLRNLHRSFRIGGDLFDIELFGAPRLMDRDEGKPLRAIAFAPARDLFRDVVT